MSLELTKLVKCSILVRLVNLPVFAPTSLKSPPAQVAISSIMLLLLSLPTLLVLSFVRSGNSLKTPILKVSLWYQNCIWWQEERILSQCSSSWWDRSENIQGKISYFPHLFSLIWCSLIICHGWYSTISLLYILKIPMNLSTHMIYLFYLFFYLNLLDRLIGKKKMEVVIALEDYSI